MTLGGGGPLDDKFGDCVMCGLGCGFRLEAQAVVAPCWE